MKYNGRTYWQFKNRIYWDNDDLNESQVNALLVTKLQREQATIERAQAMVESGRRPQPSALGAIPDDVEHLCSCATAADAAAVEAARNPNLITSFLWLLVVAPAKTIFRSFAARAIAARELAWFHHRRSPSPTCRLPVGTQIRTKLANSDTGMERSGPSTSPKSEVWPSSITPIYSEQAYAREPAQARQLREGVTRS